MTLNGVMAVTLRYFTEFGKPALQKTICGGIYARVYCIFSACTMSSQRKFTFAISFPDEFLVLPDIQKLSGDNFTFQQDGAPAHRSRQTVSAPTACLPSSSHSRR